MSAAVYRVYDADDRLIYVGATSNLAQRLNYHRTQAWWWSLAARTASEPHADMASAFDAETRAIQTERPAFNVVSRRGRPTNYQHRLNADDIQVLQAWFRAGKRGDVPMPILNLARSAA